MSISEQATVARDKLSKPMAEDERPISEQFRIVAKQWVGAQAAANILEDTRQSLFSKLVLDQAAEVSVARAEHTARASAEYMEHLTLMNNAKSKANLLRVQMKYLEMAFSECMSSDANSRRERNMGRQAT